MKLVIPGEVSVGARIFRIRMSEKILKELELKGQLVDKEELIRLMPGRSPRSTFEALIHEIEHESNYNTGADEDTPEGRVSTSAVFMAQALLSLGIEPDFSEIRDEE